MSDESTDLLINNANEPIEDTEVTKTTVTLVNLDSTIRDYPILEGSDDENNLDSIENAVTASNGVACSGNRTIKDAVTTVTFY